MLIICEGSIRLTMTWLIYLISVKKRKEKRESLECDLRIKMEAIEGKKTR